jgi:hypothetical protein
MPPTLPRQLALRTGCRAAGAAAVVFTREFPPGEGPCDLLLALAEPIAPEELGRAEDALRAARQCLAGSPGRAGGELVELLAAAHVWGRAPEREAFPAPVRLTLVGIRGRRYAVAQARSLPACLLREGLVRPITADYPLQPPERDGGPDPLAPELATGLLDDGDALLLGSNSLHERLGDKRLARLLTQTSAESAVDALVDGAVAEGADGAAAAVVFIGVGPALLARLRPQPAVLPPATPPVFAPAPTPQPASGLAVAAAVGGIALGIGLGVVIALSLMRPSPAPTPIAAPAPAGAVAPVGPPPQPSAALPAAALPAAAPTARPTEPPPTPPQPNAPAPAPSPVQPPAAAPQPAPPPDGPPSHTIATGFGAGARLFLRVDAARGLLLIQTSQGVLFGAGGQGIPVGEALSVPLTALRGQPPDDLGQLRLYEGERTAGALTADEVRGLLAGRPAAVPDLRPGDYTLRWWHPQSGAGEALYSLRLGAV